MLLLTSRRLMVAVFLIAAQAGAASASMDDQIRISDGHPEAAHQQESTPSTVSPELAQMLSKSEGTPVFEHDEFPLAERGQMAGTAAIESAAPEEAFPGGFSVTDGNPDGT